MAKIAVIGTGYVGLTTGACFAHLGHEVDLRRHRRRQGRAAESGRGPDPRGRARRLVREGLQSGRLTFVLGAAERGRRRRVRLPVRADAPGRRRLGRPQLHRGRGPRDRAPSAARDDRGQQVDRAGRLHPRRRAGARPQRRVRRVEPRVPPRGLRGPRLPAPRPRRDRQPTTRPPPSGSPRCTSASPRRCMVTDPASAETIKYASNAFLATKLSFVNAVAAVCEAVGADVNDVVLGMGYDKRIGHEFLRPGPGLGRLAASRRTRGRLLRIAEDAGYDFDLLEGVDRASTRSSSTGSPTKVVGMAGGSVDGARSSRCGASRSRPAPTTCASRRRSQIVRRLHARRARSSTAYDPAVTRADVARARRASRSSPIRTPRATGAEVLAVLTEWDEFRWLDFDKVAEPMAQPPGRRRPQPARPRRRSRAAASSTRASAGHADGAGRRHRRSRLPRLAPLRGAARPGRRGRRASTTWSPGRVGQHRAPLRATAASRSSSTT